MMDLLNELKSHKDRQLRARLEKEEIQKALKEINRDKASALERDRRRELERIAAERENLRYREENLMDDIKNLEEQYYENERVVQEQHKTLQNKVDGSEYLTKGMRQKEIELARERGEQLAKLKHQKELLEMDREKIMGDLEACKNGDISAIRRNEASRWVANDILSKNPKLDFSKVNLSESMKNKLVSGQAKINKLKEEKAKIEREAFPFIDELDVLQKQYEDKDYNQKARMIAHDLNERNIRPDIKANQLEFMRNKLERSGAPRDSDYIDEDTDDTNNSVRNPRSRRESMPVAPPPVPGMVLPALPGAFPGLGPVPGPVPGPFGFPGVPFGPGGYPFPHGQPPGMMNPNLAFLKSQIDKQEEENKRIEDELVNNVGKGKNGDFNSLAKNAEQDIEALRQKLLPGGNLAGMGGEGFPEDFVFRQNDFRSEDLEVEERAIMSLVHQDYDQMRMLSCLPVNSELYRFNMDRYKELSTMRSEVEKVLQEQRLEKLRRDFEKAKYEDERRYNHERWLEDQKRDILAAKLRRQNTNGGGRGLARANSQPDLRQNNPQTQAAITAYPQSS